jgi:hypothetical protein
MILRGTPATLSATFAQSGAVVDPGDVTVTVYRDDGTTLVPPTLAAGGGAQPRTLQLVTAETQRLDKLRAVWVSPTYGALPTSGYDHEIVGGFYASIAEIRDQPQIRVTADYPVEKLERARRWWADLVDNHCRQSFIPRYRAETRRLYRDDPHWRVGRPHVRDVYAAVLINPPDADVTLDVTQWTPYPTGRVTLPVGYPHSLWRGQLRVFYEHGLDQPDAELFEAGLTAMRHWLIDDRTGRGRRDMYILNELGQTIQRQTMAGEKRPTGIPEVDTVLNERVYTRALVA